ncbi:MAG: hypothetical protein ABIJ97_16990 [Bacteroidota bacterium]
MSVYHWIISGSFVFFVMCFVEIMLKTLALKKYYDPSLAKGKVKPAIVFSYTKAMSPAKKESAYMHLPTYTAGMIFHLGTFFCFFCLILFFVKISTPIWFSYLSAILIFSSAVCGIGLLIKRITLAKLRSLSNPDDYFSNLLVTGFQILTACSFLDQSIYYVLFIYSSALLIYIPVGKLKHTIYFFADRVHLGKYYGKRGVWPVEK